MTSSEPAEIGQRFLDALLAHDDDGAFALVAEDADVEVNGRSALSGTFNSPEHYRQTREWLFREHDGASDIIGCEWFLADDQMAVAMVTEQAHRGTESIAFQRVIIMYVERGRITKLRIIAEDTETLDEFWK